MEEKFKKYGKGKTNPLYPGVATINNYSVKIPKDDVISYVNPKIFHFRGGTRDSIPYRDKRFIDGFHYILLK